MEALNLEILNRIFDVSLSLGIMALMLWHFIRKEAKMQDEVITTIKNLSQTLKEYIKEQETLLRFNTQDFHNRIDNIREEIKQLKEEIQRK